MMAHWAVCTCLPELSQNQGKARPRVSRIIQNWSVPEFNYILQVTGRLMLTHNYIYILFYIFINIYSFITQLFIVQFWLMFIIAYQSDCNSGTWMSYKSANGCYFSVPSNCVCLTFSVKACRMLTTLLDVLERQVHFTADASRQRDQIAQMLPVVIPAEIRQTLWNHQAGTLSCSPTEHG